MEIKLTEKERLIIEMKADGMTIKQIARKLATSRGYAEQLICVLYSKTGCKNSGSLVAWGYKNSVLEINRENLPIEERKVG